MTGIRIEGTPEDIEECLRRLRSVFSINVSKDKHYEIKDKYGNIKKGEFYYYCRAYIYEPDCIFDLMEYHKKEADELAERLAAAQQEVERLRDKLQDLPQPKYGDAVLGEGHRAWRIC